MHYNRQLEEELRTLKEEHSVLKTMVRDLEQMKENEEKQIKTGCVLIADTTEPTKPEAAALALVLSAKNNNSTATKTHTPNANGATGGTTTTHSGNDKAKASATPASSPSQAPASAALPTCTEGGVHQCCSEHGDMMPDHPSKMCHRYDGLCNCYYCTIFGHAVRFFSLWNCVFV